MLDLLLIEVAPGEVDIQEASMVAELLIESDRADPESALLEVEALLSKALGLCKKLKRNLRAGCVDVIPLNIKEEN